MHTTIDRQYPAGPATCTDQWLVGLRRHAARSGETWHYYVVDDTKEGADAAVAAAMGRAAARDQADQADLDPPASITDLEVRRLRHSPLGQVYLEPGPRRRQADAARAAAVAAARRSR
ncbi:hypothetical protein PV350_31555 [Streptomyces sp. PA03-6a]|nr:hypothetical protein [Streptomyces sp. PA03-6a]